MASRARQVTSPTSPSSSTEKVNRRFKALVLLAFSVLFLTIDVMYREKMFQVSIEHQMVLRHSEYATPTLDKVARVISELGDKYIVGFLVYVTYHFMDHSKAFIVIFAAIICQSFSTLLKGIYHEARPFFLADTRPNGCRFEYGNPSGHSFIGTGLYLTIWDLLMKEYPKTPKLVKQGSFAALLGLIAILAASRVYNGVHTYNQVYSGLGWGLVTYGVLCHLVYEQIASLVHRLRKASVLGLLFNPITLMFLAAHALSVAVYFWNLKWHPIPEEWAKSIVLFCHEKEQTQHNIELHNYIQFQFCWGLMGAYLGLILDQRYLSTGKYENFFRTSFSTSVKRILIGAPFVLMTQLGMVLVSKKAGFLTLVVFRTALPTFTACFIIFGLSKWQCHRAGLINTESTLEVGGKRFTSDKQNQKKVN